MLDEVETLTELKNVFRRERYDLHLSTFASRIGALESLVKKLTVQLAQDGFISLKTWRYDLWREAERQDFATLDAFFRNADDSCYVRVRSLRSF